MTITTELMNEKRWSIQWLEYLSAHALNLEVRDAAKNEMERRAAKECLAERVSTGLQATALCGMLGFMAYVLSPDRAYAAVMEADEAATGWPIAAMILAVGLGIYWMLADLRRNSTKGDE